MVHKSKSTLEKYKNKKHHPLPDPTQEGVGGRAALWEWSIMREWLQEEFGLKQPAEFPGNVGR
jgi:hypothetical protein